MESTPYFAFINLLTKRQPIVVSKIEALRENAESALPMTKGARVMLSTPPANIKDASPARIARAAVPTASIPEPHSRLIVPPGTTSGRPASSVAIRATLRLSSPAWLAQPISASSSFDQSTLVLRAASSRTAIEIRSSGRTDASAPP